ncbi:AAA family ATPase [Novosphingobium huizhouense]|uniref:AAA family ATPase n=1 Tax=Novosphingobium huizhouense TaxID=2866625 RepID=UPI001CD848AC|nr:AAA family ATPase [Novosphingobium huizhouense]
MNDPANAPIDIEEQRAWLIEHRKATNTSWSEIAKRIGIKQGTLSQFGGPSGYSGDERRIAETVFRYRQLLDQQKQLTVEAPKLPDYFTTPTSEQITMLLNWAQRGRIIVVATGAGLGKTKTARHHRDCLPNVFIATMKPSTAGVNNMQQEVLKALGEKDAVGTPQRLSGRVMDRVRDLTNPLIIIDEAQHLSEKAIEEIRSWHDETGVGIALLGNMTVMQRLEGGARAAAFAQLYSRVSMRLIRPVPLQSDADALAEAWNVHEDDAIGYLRKIVTMPGGLRSGTMTLELAWMLASAERMPLSVQHLQDAWAQLSQRAVAA